MNFLKLIFGNPPMPQQACDGGTNPSKPTLDDAGIAFAVSKATRQLEFIARTYGFTLCEGSVEDLQADLVTMLRFRDLSSIRFELLGHHDGLVVFEFKLQFDAGKAGAARIFDSGNGIELPVLSRDLVAGRRLVIHRNGKDSGYKHLLRLPWGSAKTIQKSQGAEYESEHAARISGGRQAGSFHVTDAVRHTFVVTQTGTKGFGFARDIDTGRDGVFVLLKHWPTTCPFRVGARFTGLLVQVPKGMQVRSIRPM